MAGYPLHGIPVYGRRSPVPDRESGEYRTYPSLDHIVHESKQIGLYHGRCEVLRSVNTRRKLNGVPSDLPETRHCQDCFLARLHLLRFVSRLPTEYWPLKKSILSLIRLGDRKVTFGECLLSWGDGRIVKCKLDKVDGQRGYILHGQTDRRSISVLSEWSVSVIGCTA